LVAFVIHSFNPDSWAGDIVLFPLNRPFILSIHSLNMVFAHFHASPIFVVSTAHSAHPLNSMTFSAYAFALPICVTSVRYFAASPSAVHHCCNILYVRLFTSSALVNKLV
jgi:hypothetical protein